MAVRVKICGLTRAEDAAFAATAGASYLGVVLAGGPRQVSPAGAADVVAASRGVPVLGVFGSQSAADIAAIAREAGLAGAQLHGLYTDEEAARLAGQGLIVWRVLRIASPADLDRLPSLVIPAETVLVEPRVPHAEGGAGVALDLAAGRLVRPSEQSVRQHNSYYFVAPPHHFELPKVIRFRDWLRNVCSQFPPPVAPTVGKPTEPCFDPSQCWAIGASLSPRSSCP